MSFAECLNKRHMELIDRCCAKRVRCNRKEPDSESQKEEPPFQRVPVRQLGIDDSEAETSFEDEPWNEGDDDGTGPVDEYPEIFSQAGRRRTLYKKSHLNETGYNARSLLKRTEFKIQQHKRQIDMKKLNGHALTAAKHAVEQQAHRMHS